MNSNNQIRILLVVLLVCFYYSPVFALKWPKTNKNIAAGVMYGNICANDDISQDAWGFNAQIYGFYCDLLLKPRNHGNDVAIDRWKEKEALSYHFGYQIPILEYVRFIPVVGYSRVKTGITDGSNWKVTNSGINNAFYVTYFGS